MRLLELTLLGSCAAGIEAATCSVVGTDACIARVAITDDSTPLPHFDEALRSSGALDVRTVGSGSMVVVMHDRRMARSGIGCSKSCAPPDRRECFGGPNWVGRVTTAKMLRDIRNERSQSCTATSVKRSRAC
jgi:hypothetical protein